MIGGQSVRTQRLDDAESTSAPFFDREPTE